MSNSGDFISPSARRWLNLISFAEGTYGSKGPRYDITFGYTPIKDLSQHPDRVVRSGGLASAAAGAYQFMPGTWNTASRAVGAKDFGPRSQDLAALELIRRRGVNPDRDPITPGTIAKLAPEWASLPTLKGTSYYGQSYKPVEKLLAFAQSQGANVVPDGRYATETQQAGASASDALAAAILGSYLSKQLLSKEGAEAAAAQEVPYAYEEPGTLDAEERELERYVEQSSNSPGASYLPKEGNEVAATRQILGQILSAVQGGFTPGRAV